MAVSCVTRMLALGTWEESVYYEGYIPPLVPIESHGGGLRAPPVPSAEGTEPHTAGADLAHRAHPAYVSSPLEPAVLLANGKAPTGFPPTQQTAAFFPSNEMKVVRHIRGENDRNIRLIQRTGGCHLAIGRSPKMGINGPEGEPQIFVLVSAPSRECLEVAVKQVRNLLSAISTYLQIPPAQAAAKHAATSLPRRPPTAPVGETEERTIPTSTEDPSEQTPLTAAALPSSTLRSEPTPAADEGAQERLGKNALELISLHGKAKTPADDAPWAQPSPDTSALAQSAAQYASAASDHATAYQSPASNVAGPSAPPAAPYTYDFSSYPSPTPATSPSPFNVGIAPTAYPSPTPPAIHTATASAYTSPTPSNPSPAVAVPYASPTPSVAPAVAGGHLPGSYPSANPMVTPAPVRQPRWYEYPWWGPSPQTGPTDPSFAYSMPHATYPPPAQHSPYVAPPSGQYDYGAWSQGQAYAGWGGAQAQDVVVPPGPPPPLPPQEEPYTPPPPPPLDLEADNPPPPGVSPTRPLATATGDAPALRSGFSSPSRRLYVAGSGSGEGGGGEGDMDVELPPGVSPLRKESRRTPLLQPEPVAPILEDPGRRTVSANTPMAGRAEGSAPAVTPQPPGGFRAELDPDRSVPKPTTEPRSLAFKMPSGALGENGQAEADLRPEITGVSGGSQTAPSVSSLEKDRGAAEELESGSGVLAISGRVSGPADEAEGGAEEKNEVDVGSSGPEARGRGDEDEYVDIDTISEEEEVKVMTLSGEEEGVDSEVCGTQG